MPRYLQGVAHIRVKINGADLADEVMNHVIEVVVEQHAHLPDMFTIRVHDEMDPGSSEMPIIDGDEFVLGDTIEILSPSVDARDVPGSDVSLIKGEITALEPSFEAGNIAEFVVQGYDKSHRGFRAQNRQGFIDEKDSGAASSLINFGVSGDVESTTETYKQLSVDNQSPLEFVMERAWRLGKTTHVNEQGTTLGVKAPKNPSSGADISLEWGANLVSFRPRLSVADQVTQVEVRGWDPNNQKAIVGKATKGINQSINIGDGIAAAGKFGKSTLTIVDQPVNSAAEATDLAKARLEERTLSYVEAEGEARETPQIRAGQVVELKNLGTNFSGKYLVTSASHRWSFGDGFKTTFFVTGTRTGTFIERLTHEPPQKRWTGVYPAKVTNTTDPDKLSRAKVKFPWFDDQYESGWARIVIVGGGAQGGVLQIPEIDDEVLVAFEHGDFQRPYILGGLYSGKMKPPADIPGATKRANGRVWYSKNGHRIAIYDAGDSGIDKIEVKTAGGRIIDLNDQDKKVSITTTKGMKLTVDDNSGDIKLEGGNNIDISAKMNMKLKANGDITVDAGKNLTLKAKLATKMEGLTMAIEGKTKAEFKGLTTSIQGSTLTEVKGALVKLN